VTIKKYLMLEELHNKKKDENSAAKKELRS
jgi:hypothetical protein